MSVKLDDNVCRVCLSSSGNIPIFDECGKDDQFRYCTSLEATKDDGLPSKLCKKCNDHLKVAYDFRFQAIYAEKYFRKTIFLPSLKKEEPEGVTVVTDGRSADELDENMAEIDMLLAIHSEAPDHVDDDNGDMDNAGFYDDDSADENDKHVEVIGMETFEKEQREQKEQKVKTEIASVVAQPPVSSNTAKSGFMSTMTEADLVIDTSKPPTSSSSVTQPPGMEINTIQQYTPANSYPTHNEENSRSLQLEIVPAAKNDASQYEFNAGTTVCGSFDPYGDPNHISYQQGIPMHLQYEPQTNAQSSTLSLQSVAVAIPTTTHYEYAYQDQFPSYVSQTLEIAPVEQAEHPPQAEPKDVPLLDPSSQPELENSTKTEIRLSLERKPKKSKGSRRDKIECNICGSNFTHLNSLKTHLLKHSGEKPFRCEFCDKAFARKTVLNIHRRLHTGEKPYKCSLCPSAYVTKEALMRHLQKDHEQEVGANFRKDKVSYICSICNKSRCSKYSLASHMKTHSKDAKARRKVVRRKKEKSDAANGAASSNVPLKYSCRICQKGFPNKWELSTHAESHDMHKTFECDVCQRTFEKKFQLLYHLQTHDGGEELVKAKVRPSSGKTDSQTKLIEVVSKDEKEPLKSSEKKTKAKLPSRKRKKKNAKIVDEDTDGEDDETDKDYNKLPSRKSTRKASRAQRENLKVLRANSKIECHICEAVFTHPTSLKTHMLVHSGERPFKCDHCDKSFARKTVLNIHRRLHTGEKPYKCPLCDSACVTKDALMRHMSKDHDDDREADRIKFTCGICHKAMGTKYSLQAHMKLHEQNSNADAAVKYSCNTCTEAFDTKTEYAKHMEVHDSNRNFQCDICQVTFEKKFKLLFHLQTHKIEDLPCKKCGETFTIRENLIQHIKLQHMDPRNMDFQCPHCNVGQYDTRDLKLHMSAVHDISMGGLNSCDMCGDSYSTAAEYYKHMHEKHDTISKTCNECDKYFDSRKVFDKHILTHYM